MDSDDDGVGDLKGKGKRADEHRDATLRRTCLVLSFFFSYDRVSPSTV